MYYNVLVPVCNVYYTRIYTIQYIKYKYVEVYEVPV